MTLIESHREWKAARQSEMVKEVREKLDRALQLHLPGIDVWVYGSLVKPGRLAVIRM
jgi:hypothetical protein